MQKQVPFFQTALTPDIYNSEIRQEGFCTRFRDGVVYRYPGIVALLEVSGSHYEMGLQYGVLLSPEIKIACESYERVFTWTAEMLGSSVPDFYEQLRRQASLLLKKIPQRFVDELQGISEGAGMRFEDVAVCSLMYDILSGMACTGLLMRAADGRIIHGRNNDTGGYGGEELAMLPVVVKHKARGFHTLTHLDFVLFLGIETGSNVQGLAFSEETLKIQEPDPQAMSLVYLVRMILEECSSLSELPDYFEKYPVVGAYGMIWSDRKAGEGQLIELTPTAWNSIPLKDSLLWDFNHIVSPNLLEQQTQSKNFFPDPDREALAEGFFRKPEYSLQDAVDFLRLQVDPQGRDYTRKGRRHAVCNHEGQQMVIFDPLGDGFYLALGTYYAACQNVYHIFDDFSRQPELALPGVDLPSAVVERAHVENLLVNQREKRDRTLKLARSYRDEANLQFLCAYYSFLLGELPLYADFARKAHELDPDEFEYVLYMGLAAYQIGEYSETVKTLEEIPLASLYQRDQALALYLLTESWQHLEPQKSEAPRKALEELLSEMQAEDHFLKELVPLIERQG
jgi:tetratricopeptide (TPR) repeat protein